MRHLQKAREQLRRFLGSGGSSTPLKFTTPGGTVYEINGIANVVTLELDVDGTGRFEAVGDKSSVTFCEADLTDMGATLRRNGQIDMGGWQVEFNLPHGLYTGYMAEPLPDSTLGIIKYKIGELYVEPDTAD